jgi:3-hydroxybutyryl-CoA dehydrogenase
MSNKIRNVGVIGAGTMGNGIAQTFAAAGYSVTMRDLKSQFLDRGIAAITKSLDRLALRGKITREDRDATLRRIKPTTELSDLANCDIVVEAILENYDLKAALLKELDATCREDAIFATNTSSISVTHIAAASKAPKRVVGMHFFNPVPLMQLVEVIRALQTSDEVCDAVVTLTGSLGKSARVSKDSYGFVVNRVLIPMINEAINCAQEGVATPEDIDEMMKLGANHPMGPLALADLIGLDIVQEIMETLYEGFGDPKYRPSLLLKQMCAAGYLGRKTGRGFFAYENMSSGAQI